MIADRVTDRLTDPAVMALAEAITSTSWLHSYDMLPTLFDILSKSAGEPIAKLVVSKAYPYRMTLVWEEVVNLYGDPIIELYEASQGAIWLHGTWLRFESEEAGHVQRRRTYENTAAERALRFLLSLREESQVHHQASRQG